jgi:hypothetical protein
VAEEFEFRDLSGAVFWGVNLEGATFRDVDLTGARFSHARLADVVIDAEIDRLVVNGVDVTAYVNERDEWFALRSQIRPADTADMREGWQAISDAWVAAIERAHGLGDGQCHASVDGEWSFVQTLRHLVFATDKWFTAPVLGGTFHPIGVPNSGSADFDWPGIDATIAPTFDEAVAVWQGRSRNLREYIDDVEPEALAATVDVLENGSTAVGECIGVVFEEHFQHLRYALRDLGRLA